jgi:Holliday junction resolvase RusA-like endonuclease
MVELGWRMVCGHMRPPLQKPVAGLVCFVFQGPPPTATHHAKSIAMRGDKVYMINNAVLCEAHNYYARQLPPRQILTPIKGPLYADVTFWMPTPAGLPELAGMPCQEKPDRDNAVKVLFDELAIGGWIDRDEQITDGPIRKRWALPQRSGVVVFLATITDPNVSPASRASFNDAFKQAGKVIDSLKYAHGGVEPGLWFGPPAQTPQKGGR